MKLVIWSFALTLLTGPAFAGCYDPQAARNGGPLGALAMAIGQPCQTYQTGPSDADRTQQLMLENALRQQQQSIIQGAPPTYTCVYVGGGVTRCQ
jgi:hypothetical protein